jgi:hypothetical protein
MQTRILILLLDVRKQYVRLIRRVPQHPREKRHRVGLDTLDDVRALEAPELFQFGVFRPGTDWDLRVVNKVEGLGGAEGMWSTAS